MKKHFTSVLSVGVLTSALLVGCGGSSGTSGDDSGDKTPVERTVTFEGQTLTVGDLDVSIKKFDTEIVTADELLSRYVGGKDGYNQTYYPAYYTMDMDARQLGDVLWYYGENNQEAYWDEKLDNNDTKFLLVHYEDSNKYYSARYGLCQMDDTGSLTHLNIGEKNMSQNSEVSEDRYILSLNLDKLQNEGILTHDDGLIDFETSNSNGEIGFCIYEADYDQNDDDLSYIYMDTSNVLKYSLTELNE